MDTLSYESFLTYAKHFIELSNKITDNWELIDIDPENVYLKKVIIEPSAFINGLYLKWEYMVYYSCSYAVPVLCFNIWKSNGSLLKLEEVWEHCNLRCNSKEELYSALTQQENPILLKPYFTIHPCKTAEILNVNDCNPIIRYLSSIGPMVNLALDLRYGTLKENFL